MPAVARKVAPDSHQDYRSTNERASSRRSTPARNRWHESPEGKSSEGKTARASQSTARRSTPKSGNDTADLRGLLDHFSGESALRAHQEQQETEARRAARRRARLCHRPFRLTVFTTVMAGAPLAILACLLWMNSSALALSREDAALQNKIEATRSELEQTRREIASVNASPQVEQWAKERGWRRAGQNDFDAVPPVVETTPADSSAANSDVS